MEDDPTLEEVLTAVKAADERKAENIVAIRVRTSPAVETRCCLLCIPRCISSSSPCFFAHAVVFCSGEGMIAGVSGP